MKLLKSKKTILILIILFGLFLRFYKIAEIPPGLTWDEAALGYNAYSILKTGRDEYGQLLPLTLKSFGDYKPALYAYIDIPFIAIFGLNELAVRLPSAISGLFFIVLVYLLTKEIFKKESIALISAFFAAISPLSIQFSRAGFESNIAVTLNLFGLYFFLKGLKNSKLFYASAISLILSMLCYQGSKLFVPILVLGLIFLFARQVKISKNLIISFILVAAAGIGIYASTFLFGQSDRLATQNLFAYRRQQSEIDQVVSESGFEQGSFMFEFLHGQWWEFVRGIFERYLVYFAPDILFIEGDYSPRHSVPELGILNFYAILLLPLGLYFIWSKKDPNSKILIFWLFTASIPAVLSRDLISMVRALNLMFPFAILEALGFYYLITILYNYKKIIGRTSAILLTSIVLGNFALYLDYYFVHLPKDTAEGWLYGYKQIITQMPDTTSFDHVVFTDEYGQPYIYYLFYKKYPPEKYQPQATLVQDTVDVGTVRNFDNFEFRKINWPIDRGLENTLFIGTDIEIPDYDVTTEAKSEKLTQIDFPDGKPAFKIVKNTYDE